MTIGETEFRQLDEKYGSGRQDRPHLLGRAWAPRPSATSSSGWTSRSCRRALHAEVRTSSGQRRKKAIKRLRLIEAFRRSGNRPEWMILSVLPVIPPDLRPMVQLDGGRFATSDLNDLYRRVINRNNRLKRLLELGAPEIIIRNEKRMLQEACDALIDNGRRGRAIAGTGNHRLKSLSDMLKGKQGRFRQNLLGKRVDYSGRSVIVVGPELKLHQCGLPKKMALELFKPFVMRQLVEKGFAHNIKSAKRIVERVRPEVWDVLEEVIKDHPVLLNRAPTLHRLGIQAFMPVLVEGSAIQIHPLVCTAFNADFDGDQMAVHVPLSTAAQEEAKVMMLSTANLLSPADGSPVVAPTQDMVLGCYYLTMDAPADPRQEAEVRAFASEDDAIIAYELGARGIESASRISSEREEGDESPRQAHTARQGAAPRARGRRRPGLGRRDRRAASTRSVRTTVGRILFNRILPDRAAVRQPRRCGASTSSALVDTCYRLLGPAETAHLVDGIKSVGFKFATRGGLTIGLWDIVVPKEKKAMLVEADEAVAAIDKQFQRGLITEDERYEQVVELWQRVTKDVSDQMMDGLGDENPVRMMTDSGARGNKGNIGQLGAMRGLMADPSGPDHRRARAEQLPRGHDGPRVLHQHPRRPQGPRGHRPPHRGLRVPHPAPRGRRAGRHHPRGRLRHARGELDHPRPSPRTSPRRSSAGSSGGSWRPTCIDPKAKVKKGETAPLVVARDEMIDEEHRARRSTRPASTRCWSAHRSPASRATASAGSATAATSPPAR